MQKSPFKFLDSYSREDRNIFFGRDKEIEELYSRVFQSRVLIVYGISGTGKSSLINCGLANKFNESDWLPVSVRRGLNINTNLADNLAKNALTGNVTGRKNDIVKLLKSVYLDHFKPVFLIFDQFEEVFIFGTRDERIEFIETIRKILDSGVQCRIIFSIREEYLAGFTEFEKSLPTILDNRIRIEKMTRQNAMRVIEGPCEISNITVDQGFSENLLEKLNPDSPEVELTYLQVFLDKIFRKAVSEGEEVNSLENRFIDDAGDVKDILGSFLEEQITNLEDPASGMIILKSFVSVRGTKHLITEEEVIEYSRTFGQDIDQAAVKSLIQKFIKLRILRDKDEHGRYELRHDSLASIIYEKITLVEKELLEIRQFIENSYRNFEKRKLYLTSEDLSYIAPYEDKLFLNDRLLKFIDESKWELHRVKRRRQNALIIAAAVLIGVLSFFTVWAMRERGNALDQKKFAEEQKDEALKAKSVADSARLSAVRSGNLADSARKEAVAEREYALQQKTLAEKMSFTAKQQAIIANEQKVQADRERMKAEEERAKAEQERLKAVAAEEKARRLSMLSNAQNLALTSSNPENDPVTGGAFAVEAYYENKANGGELFDPVIYDALNKAWISLDSSAHSRFTGSPAEIRSITGRNDELITADLDGMISCWNFEGKIIKKSTLELPAPLIFVRLNASGNTLVAQDDNSNVSLWRSEPGNIIFKPSALKGHHGFLMCADFYENFLVTGGRDSIVNIWNFQNETPELISSFKNASAVMSVIFSTPDTIVFACEDGKIIARSVKDGENRVVYSSTVSKPLCLAWNRKENKLLAGFSDGNLCGFASLQGSASAEIYDMNDAGIDILTFNADYSLLAACGRNRTIRIYHVNEFFIKEANFKAVIQLNDLPGRIRSAVFTEGERLAAGFSDRSIRIWETSSEKLVENINLILKPDTSLTGRMRIIH